MEYSPDRFAEKLAGRLLRYLPEVGSTNDVALDWLRAGAPPGAVVLADAQIKGRGRLGRRWHAPAGTALIVSVILFPSLHTFGQMTMLGAVSIAETLEAVGAQAIDIKWPNDVRLKGRKVCGILPEAAWDGDQLRGVALGIGLNVRVDFGATELAGTAISLESALGRRVDRLDMLARLLNRVDYWAGHSDTPALFDAWKQRLSTLGQEVAVTTSAVRGIAEAVDAQGALLVRTADGTLERVIAGDIRLGE